MNYMFLVCMLFAGGLLAGYLIAMITRPNKMEKVGMREFYGFVIIPIAIVMIAAYFFFCDTKTDTKKPLEVCIPVAGDGARGWQSSCNGLTCVDVTWARRTLFVPEVSYKE